MSEPMYAAILLIGGHLEYGGNRDGQRLFDFRVSKDTPCKIPCLYHQVNHFTKYLVLAALL